MPLVTLVVVLVVVLRVVVVVLLDRLVRYHLHSSRILFVLSCRGLLVDDLGKCLFLVSWYRLRLVSFFALKRLSSWLVVVLALVVVVVLVRILFGRLVAYRYKVWWYVSLEVLS